MNSNFLHVFIISIWLLTLVACAPGGYNKQRMGATVGAVGGAAACSNVGKGKGKLVAMLACGGIGAWFGSTIGAYMDEIDKRQVINTIQSVPAGVITTWVNHGGSNYVKPTTNYFQSGNQQCRKYQAKILVKGNYETGEGTACRRPDGYWDI